MPKNNNRQGRIDEEFRKELSQLISFELKEPSVTGMVSVTKVKVTPDLKYANTCRIKKIIRIFKIRTCKKN